jgi:hypothetical protein
MPKQAPEIWKMMNAKPLTIEICPVSIAAKIHFSQGDSRVNMASRDVSCDVHCKHNAVSGGWASVMYGF